MIPKLAGQKWGVLCTETSQRKVPSRMYKGAGGESGGWMGGLHAQCVTA